MCFGSQSSNFEEISASLKELKNNKNKCSSSACQEAGGAEIQMLTQLRGSNQTLCNTFFSQLELLRRSCNDFEGLQKNIAAVLQEDQAEKRDLIELITLLEYLTPSHSLDLLTLIIIAAGLPEQGGCAKLKQLDIFKLLR